jgi:hypothetical protein
MLSDRSRIISLHQLSNGAHTISLPIKTGEADTLTKHGMWIMLLPHNVIGSLTDIELTIELFTAPFARVKEMSVQFLEERWSTYGDPYTFTHRKNSSSIWIDEKDVRSGDYFAIRHWSGMDVAIRLGTGGQVTSFISFAVLFLINHQLHTLLA